MTQDARRSAAMGAAAAAAVCAMVVTGAGVAAAAPGGTWGTAREVPGTAALNHFYAQVNSLSCASAGNCSAGGSYTDSSLYSQAFVASEVNGTWHTAREVPGTAALNQGGQAAVNSVSCASAGNCASSPSASSRSTPPPRAYPDDAPAAPICCMRRRPPDNADNSCHPPGGGQNPVAEQW